MAEGKIKKKAKKEPVLIAGVVTGVLLAVASYFNVVIDEDTLKTAVIAALPVVSSILARQKVSPID